jgi:hypothetical protein
MKGCRWWASCAILALVSGAFAQDEVKIDSGSLRGVSKDGIASFKGIPFAAPPVGNLLEAPTTGPALDGRSTCI